MFALMLYSFRTGSGGTSRELENEEVFRALVEGGRVEKCELVRENGGKTYVKGVRTGGEQDEPLDPAAPDAKPIPKNFTLSVMPDTEKLQEYLREHNVPVKVRYSSPVLTEILIQVIPILIFVGLMVWLFSRQMKGAGGPLAFSKSRARKLDNEKRKITFANVAGIDEAKEEVQEIIEFLKDPAKFAKLGGRIPKGVLLMGPPGTGKTLLAKAIAGEAGVPFFSISGSDFDEMFVGVGASRVRDLFEQGKKNAPCINFIDEIDAVGRSRSNTGSFGGRHDEQTINALLVEMDGFETSEGVILVAATNRPDVLDKALLRPGRFDRQIVIDLPTLEGRKEILALHASKLKMAEGVDLERIARGTPGFSGADLANLLNEAALLAARLGKEAVELSDLEEARDKVAWGRERRGRMADAEEKRLTAVHEAGHAIVMSLVKGGEPIHKVTIIPRGMALGATMFLPKKDRLSYTRTQMLANLATSMGGRVAEELFLDDISSGASQDLKEATHLAHHMVCDWGMSEKLGPRTFGAHEDMVFWNDDKDYSDATAQAIDAEVDALIRDAHKTATEILSSHKNELNVLVEELLEKETVDGTVVEEIVKFGRVLTDVERHAADAPPPPPPEAASEPKPEEPPTALA
ncbi:MAG: ATP-dependent zinc metalloprotease FtsH [Kiritimatiellae bacterium]|nr:ATP-dependent zinc metalloprotease FtsH [Kiritimatiellia bacterium]